VPASAAQAAEQASKTATPNRRISVPTKALTEMEPIVEISRMSPRSAIGAPNV
jgi:hypothetical protein